MEFVFVAGVNVNVTTVSGTRVIVKVMKYRNLRGSKTETRFLETLTTAW